jgi:head-tail adaptor
LTLSAGELSESVVVQVASKSTNSYGETVLDWSVFATRRAAIEGRTITEAVNAEQPYTSGAYNVRFRYLPGLTSEMRLIWTSRSPARTLDIVAVTEKGMREEHQLVCKEWGG